MPNDFTIDDPRVAQRRRANGRYLVLALVGAIAIGAGTALWAGNRLGLIDFRSGSQVAAPLTVASQPAPSPSVAAAGLESAQTALNVRMAELEQRMTRLNLQAEAASGNAARAEGLMITAAVRRTVERGQQLGYLGDELKARFGDTQPNAVQTLIEVSNNPVTLDALQQGLAGLSPSLLTPPRNDAITARISVELANLFVLRKASAPSPAPARRLDRANLFLETGRVEAAIEEVRRMPGASVGSDWLALAERYVRAQRALDLIETAAIVEPMPPSALSAQPAGARGSPIISQR